MKKIYLKLLIFLSGNNLYTRDDLVMATENAMDKAARYYSKIQEE